MTARMKIIRKPRRRARHAPGRAATKALTDSSSSTSAPAWMAGLPRAPRLPANEIEHAAELDAAARELTGAGPGDPAYEAIVHPRLGRPPKGEAYPTVVYHVRIEQDAGDLLRRRASDLGVHESQLIRAAVLKLLGPKR